MTPFTLRPYPALYTAPTQSVFRGSDVTVNRQNKSDTDESLADTSMSLNVAEFRKRYAELMEEPESTDEAPLEEEPAVEKASSVHVWSIQSTVAMTESLLITM